MRKKIFIILIYIIGVSLSAETLNWFLASSMIRPGKEVVELFNKKQNRYNVRLITGGSGDLLSKIVLSEYGGIYTPASRMFLKLAKDKGVVNTYFPFLEQKTVFALGRNIKDNKLKFDKICSGKYTIIYGNPKVMALGGIYLKFKAKLPEILKKSIKDSPLGVNAVQIVNYLKNGNIDVGFIFKPIAEMNNLSYVEIPDKYEFSDTAYLISLNNTENKSAVNAFEKFLFNNREIFQKYGFFVYDGDGI
jgi:ABC-type molybdate transport system substrate-binding protein